MKNIRLLFSAIIASCVPTVIIADSIPDQHLDGITVTAKSPAMRVTTDRTVFNIESTVNGNSGTLLDALSDVPGISVSPNGSVTMYGNRGATLLIHGQKNSA